MTSEAISSSTATARDSLTDLEAVLGRLGDGDLHRADPEGGWTCAQVVSHIHLAGLLWIATLERLRQHPEARMFVFREELGHDAVGAIPATAREAAARIASLRTALERYLPRVEPAVLAKEIDVPPFGPFSIETGMPLIIAHLAGHCGQLRDILKTRGALPET